MIHEEICTYEVAKLAKEKGFPLQKVIKQDGRAFFYELPQSHPDWANCDAWYLPTQSLLQRWLRDNGFGEVEVRHWSETNKYPHHYGWEVKDNLGVLMSYSSKMFDTYEHALEDALAYSLKNLVQVCNTI